MSSLRVCEVCSRHVFVAETTCPFCGELLLPVTVLERGPVLAGLSRAQRFAIAAAVAGQSLAGCSGPKTPLLIGPEYGAPIVSTGGQTAGASGAAGGSFAGSSGAIASSGGSVATPPPLDAGSTADEDAGVAIPTKDGGPRVQPVYGAPVVHYGAPIPPQK